MRRSPVLALGPALLALSASVPYAAASDDASIVTLQQQQLEQQQYVLTTPDARHSNQHEVDPAILAAVASYEDPVAAFISLYPSSTRALAEPRLLHVSGEQEPRWLTEGDKFRLRRRGLRFADVTDHEEFYKQVAAAETLSSSKPHLPELTHQIYVKPLFPQISTQRMNDTLTHLTSFYTRAYFTTEGARSSQWLYSQVAEAITKAPFKAHISLEFFTHDFPQPSIIARFEPKVKNFSQPLTIVGAHQDSMNYLFPLLPAPGADDDGSGTVSNLEAFRVLAENGYVPLRGPVEFHWYAAEENGLYGSQAIARYKKESGANITAMLQFDGTAYIKRNATEKIGVIKPWSDEKLAKWLVDLAKEYSSIDSGLYGFGEGFGSDHISFAQVGYPSAFVTECDPLAGGKFPGDYNPWFHTVNDTMDVNDEHGYFSFDHMARFSEFALAFVIEQAGWDNKWWK